MAAADEADWYSQMGRTFPNQPPCTRSIKPQLRRRFPFSFSQSMVSLESHKLKIPNQHPRCHAYPLRRTSHLLRFIFLLRSSRLHASGKMSTAATPEVPTQSAQRFLFPLLPSLLFRSSFTALPLHPPLLRHLPPTALQPNALSTAITTPPLLSVPPRYRARQTRQSVPVDHGRAKPTQPNAEPRSRTRSGSNDGAASRA